MGFLAIRIRARRPPAFPRPSSSRAEAAPDLSALTERFDIFLLNAFGVLNVGETAISGAPERVIALQRAGKRVLVLTNGASYPADMTLDKYRRLGFDLAPEDVIASRDAMSLALAARPPMVWGVMATAGSRLDLLPAHTRLLGDAPQLYADMDGFILLGSGEWTGARQDMLAQTLRRRPRPVLVGNPDIVAPRESGLSLVLVGNPDIVAPRESGLSLEPGWFAHDLARRAGATPEFYGKPYASIFDLAFSRLGGAPRARIAMVGDTLHTDILGGAAAGVKTVLITGHGLFAGRDLAPYIRASGITPDFIVPTT